MHSPPATQLHDNDIAYFAPDLLTSDESPDTSEGGSRRRRGATSNQQKLWPNGVIYYTVSSSFSGMYNVPTLSVNLTRNFTTESNLTSVCMLASLKTCHVAM